MRIVLFLGAGFSAPFGLPVMDGFLSFAQNGEKITDDDKKFLDELVLDARQANSFLQSRPANLEDILSFAVMGDRLRLVGPNKLERVPRIIKILQKIYSQVSDPADTYFKKYDVLKGFLGFDLTQSKHELSIITTNYDLNIECSLYRCGRSASLPFQAQQIQEGQYNVSGSLYASNGIPLFKLHGSVNWFGDIKDKDSFKVDRRIIGVMSIKAQNVLLPLICTGYYECKDTPIIVPPSFLKPEFVGPMQQIWSGAAKALGTAEIVAFVGYSFPSTDTEMNFFLARSFVNNPRLRKIIIIDKQANSIVQRLKSDISGLGSHFKELLDPIEKDWTRSNLTIQ